MEWDFLKALGWVLLSAIAMWVSLGHPVRNIKELWDYWRAK